jgi:hypothetical protein
MRLGYLDFPRGPYSMMEAATGETEQRIQFQRFLRQLMFVAVAFGVVNAAGATLLDRPRMQISATVLAAFGAFVMTLSRWGERFTVAARATALGYVMIVTVVVIAALLPSFSVTLGLGAIIAVLAAIPYVQGKPLKRLLVFALIAIHLVLLVGHFALRQQYPWWVHLVDGVGGRTTAAYLILFLLWQFSARLRSVLERERNARQSALKAQERSDVLAQASAQLAEAASPKEVISRLCELTVPQIADWCTVSLMDGCGVPRRIAGFHRDPAKQPLADAYLKQFPPNRHPSKEFQSLLQSGKSNLTVRVNQEMLERNSQSPEHLELIRALGVASSMSVPLMARGQVLGVLSLIRADESKPFAFDDLAMAEDLARRAAMALENAQLHENQRKGFHGGSASLKAVGQLWTAPRAKS